MIVVEGDADRVIVEAVAEALGVDLDRLGAVVIELDGAEKFKNIFPLVGPDGFGPTILGLVDEKESSKWVNAFGKKPTTIVDKKIFISAVDLEDEYTRALGGPASVRALVDSGLYREDRILQAAKVLKLDDVTPEAVAKFCRNKKVDAARCIAEALSKETAEKIGSVSRLLHALEELSVQ